MASPTDAELIESLESSQVQIESLQQQFPDLVIDEDPARVESRKQYHSKLIKMRKQRKDIVCFITTGLSILIFLLTDTSLVQ